MPEFVTLVFAYVCDGVLELLLHRGSPSEAGRRDARRRGMSLKVRDDLPMYPHYERSLDRERSIGDDLDGRGALPNPVLRIRWRETKDEGKG